MLRIEVQQVAVQEIRCRRDFPADVQKAGAACGQYLLRHDVVGDDFRLRFVSKDDREIDRVQQHGWIAVGGAEPKVQCRKLREQFLQARGEKLVREGRAHRDRDLIASLPALQLFAASGDLDEPVGNDVMQVSARRSQLDVPAVSQDERDSQVFLELPELLGNGGLRDADLVCHDREVLVPGGGLEGAKGRHRRKLLQMVLHEFTSA